MREESDSDMNVFAYGTLMYPELLNILTEQSWNLKPAVLTGYRRCTLLIEGFGLSPFSISFPTVVVCVANYRS